MREVWLIAQWGTHCSCIVYILIYTRFMLCYCVHLNIHKVYVIINKEHHCFFKTGPLSASWFFSFPSFIALAAPGFTISLDCSLSYQLYSTPSPYCPHLTMSLGINTSILKDMSLFVCFSVSVCVRACTPLFRQISDIWGSYLTPQGSLDKLVFSQRFVGDGGRTTAFAMVGFTSWCL